jgi:hypothetical protein
MWSYFDKRKFLLKLKLIVIVVIFLATILALLGIFGAFTYGLYLFAFKMSDHDQGIAILIALPILFIIGIVLEWPNLRKFKIGNYLNKNHIANKLMIGYFKTWGRFVLICWVGVLGLNVIFICGAVMLDSVGFSQNISLIIAAVPTIIFVIFYIIWAKKYQPSTYRDFLAKNASVLEEKIIPSATVRDLLSELDDTPSSNTNHEPH